MIAVRTTSGHRLRPVHLFLMLYRYLSGAYQLGDLSALNYLKGFLDGRDDGRAPARLLSVSGHGIGEPELWLSDRYPSSRIDVLSFRLLDTQLLQFLRAAGAPGVVEVFEQFRDLVQPFPALAELVADVGLVPYWELQADEWRTGRREHVTVYSASPASLPATTTYEVAYVSNSTPYVDDDVIERIRPHVEAGGWIALLEPAAGDAGADRFSRSPYTTGARRLLNAFLESHRVQVTRPCPESPAQRTAAAHVELIPLAIPAPARSVLVGELLLALMHEPVSDRLRIEALGTVLASVAPTDMPVKDVLQLVMIRGLR
jgi:hypothetical protein